VPPGVVRTSGLLLRALTSLSAAAGSALGLRAIGSTRGTLGPVNVAAGLTLATRGGTVADLGPLGTARLATHAGPVQLRITTEGIEVDDLLHGADLAALRAELPGAAGLLLRRAAARSAAGVVFGAATLTALVTRSPRRAAVAGGLATAALGAAAARAAVTRDPDAWRTAEFTGPLQHAPKIVGDVRDIPAKLDRYRVQLLDLLDTATAVQHSLRTLPEPPGEDGIRLVHVSDIHLNPLVLPLTKLLVERYRADAVLDTGDLVDWGTPAEQRIVAGIATLGVPYVYVKGNHDSAGIAAAVARQPNATVLDGSIAEIAGLTVAGLADPRFTPDKTTGDDRGMPKVAAAGRRFAAFLAGKDVDVALVHSPAAARSLAGLVPLVLAGDIHRRETRTDNGTTTLVQGSSGGAGLRGVQQDPPTPLTLSVLHLDRATRRLQAVDDVTLGGLGATDVRVARRLATDLVATG
jgi:predicted MPP superfamily phosphohydrolase